MAITTYILLAAASLLPALATSAGRCFREKDLISFSLLSLCVIWEATMISAFFHADYMMALLDKYGQSIRSYYSYICVASLLGCILVNLMLLLTVRYMKKQHALKWIMSLCIIHVCDPDDRNMYQPGNRCLARPRFLCGLLWRDGSSGRCMGIDIQRNMCHWKYLLRDRDLSVVCPVAYLEHNQGIRT